MEEVKKSCSTCERKSFNTCNYSGYSLEAERKVPTKCGQNYEKGWIKRRSILTKIKDFWIGENNGR